MSIKSSLPGLLMVIISLVVLSQALMMEDQSVTDPSSGSFFPALISVIMLAAGIFTIFQDNRARAATQQSDKDAVEKAPDTTTTASESNLIFTKKDYQLIIAYFALVVGFVLLLPVLTFFPAAFLFLIASMFFLKGVSWFVNIAVSIGTIVVIYFLFSQLFNIVFP
ncbi:Tripartite tricarboxylate transporter TctB family protein [Alteribacillus persepolensis]|uniref:Tripartite tricarboxylate transporter TctB family protein n=1 Tax=Alteribacillus persepolensis TaxID=568899 RepID=A0A1G8B025_9BACI|nr:tripartite tricarboxylate transporter TctB family protein [Alteribacillus persepolensis]SDH26506.1 Tripartite tricarboxylate transporter TctB family protein [Alteribacillus persepolensis]